MSDKKQYVSLCIPRISSTISKEFVYNTLKGIKMGYIQKLTEIPLKNDPTQKRIMIKICYNEKEDPHQIRKQLDEFGSIKLVYDMPWYWKIVVANNPHRYENSCQ
mgnify:CR=1 FL=1